MPVFGPLYHAGHIAQVSFGRNQGIGPVFQHNAYMIVPYTEQLEQKRLECERVLQKLAK